VQDAADALGLDIAVRVMTDRPARRRKRAACGVTVGQIVKSLVSSGADSGSRIAARSGREPRERKGGRGASRREIETPRRRRGAALTGYAIGGIPPFAMTAACHVYRSRSVGVRRDLGRAGTPKAVFRTEPAKLRDATQALW